MNCLPLEPRLLLAVVHIDDVIRITGSARDERMAIEISLDKAGSFVQVNQERIEFQADVRKVTIDSGEGDDRIRLNVGGADIIVRINGGPGNDDVAFSGAAAAVRGGSGDDVVQVRAKVPGAGSTLYGGNGNDQLRSRGPADDVFYGGEGNDTLVGSGGSEVGEGKNTLYGGPGNDVLKGARGNDTVVGGEGDDVLHGNGGDDLLMGGAGTDRFFGDSGNDVLNVSKKEMFDPGTGDDQVLV